MFKLKRIVESVILSLLITPILPVQAANSAQSGSVSVVQGGSSSTNAVPVRSSTIIQSLLDKAAYWKQQNRMDHAVATWKRILLSKPDQQEALAELAIYYGSDGVRQIALSQGYLERLKRINPKHPAFVLIKQHNPDIKIPEPWDQLALADRFLKQGDFVAAEQNYRTALNTSPNFPEALLGMANALLKQKKYEAAIGFLDRYEAQKKGFAASAGLRSEIYMKKGAAAEAAGDIDKAGDFYAKAKALQPADPWVTLSLARMLRKQGKQEDARREIDRMTESSDQRDSRYAGALFYAEANKWPQVLLLLNQILARDRTADIQVLHRRALISSQTDFAKRRYAEHAEEESFKILQETEKNVSGESELIAIVAGAWMDIRRPDRAIALLVQAQPLPDSLQILYAGALLQAGENDKLERVLNDIDSNATQANSNKDALDGIRVAFVQRKVESLRLDGKFADGLKLLQPMLEKHPDNTGLLLARARLQGATGAYQEVLKDVDAVLVREPSNHEAIRLGANDAIQMNDYALAERYLSSSKKDDADWAALYLEAGYAAEAAMNHEKATRYLTIGGKATPKVKGTKSPAQPNQQPSINDTQSRTFIETAYAIRYRSGLSGLGYMYEKEVPLALHIPLEQGNASLVFKAAGVSLDAGDAGPWFDLFGTNLPAAPLPMPYPINAHGVALSAAYQSAALSADIGVSPLGFQFNNVVGGVRWNKDIGGSNVALEASRRSVAESVLSYAGVVDNVTGLAWGGVSKTGVQASVYRPFNDDWSGYASAAYYGYSGTNVANNESNHLSVSLINKLARTDDFEATISARLSHSGFQKNLSSFFWGNGGYYSPQSDNSFTIPLHLAGKTMKLSYELNLSASFSDSVQASSLVYPTDPVRQAAMGVAGIRLGSISSGKQLLGLDWIVEYELAPQLSLGNRYHYEESTVYQQTGIMFYLRYDFNKPRPRAGFSLDPIVPYYITTQGGAGLN